MNRFAQIIELPQDRLGTRIKNASRGGGCHTRHRAVQQFDLELILENRELLAQRGLGNTAQRGGARNAAAVDNLYEVSESACIHAGIIRAAYEASQSRCFREDHALAYHRSEWQSTR